MMSIKGLSYVEEYLTDAQIRDLMQFIETIKDWNSKLGRLVKHYGYSYDYKKKTVKAIDSKIPDILLKLVDEKYKFNQVIINRYKPDESISPHIDAPVFGNIIQCISLGVEGEIIFSRSNMKNIKLKVVNGSSYMMQDEVRQLWKHSYKNNSLTTDRYSITYR